MKEIIYNNLKQDYLKYNCWKTNESFPIDNIEEKILDQFYIREYIFSGINSNRTQENFDFQLNVFKNGVFKILKENQTKNYLFKIEHKPQIINRLRSFKGLLNKKEVPSFIYQEKEIIIDKKESIIAIVIELNNEFININDYIPFDSSNSFIISSDRNYLNDEFIIEVTSLFDIKNYIEINYWKLICKFCFRKDNIYRIGGDSGEEYWSLQEFGLKSDIT